MKTFKEMTSFHSEKWATEKKVFRRVYFRITVTHGTYGIPKIMSEFVFKSPDKVLLKVLCLLIFFISASSLFHSLMQHMDKMD